MIGTGLKLLMWVLGLFGFGKPDPVKQGEEIRDGQEAKAVLAEVAAPRAAVTDSVREQTYRD